MPKKHDPDAAQDGARVVRESTGKADELPTDAEAAWAAWIARIHGVDERTRTLLRAAFEAGAATRSKVNGHEPDAVALGRRGGLKGGKARAEKLGPEKLSESARRAAQARWGRPIF